MIPVTKHIISGAKLVPLEWSKGPGTKKPNVNTYLPGIKSTRWEGWVQQYRSGNSSIKGVPFIKQPMWISIDFMRIYKLDKLIERISGDQHLVALFKNLNQDGMTAIFKVPPGRQIESFNTLREYLQQKYQLQIRVPADKLDSMKCYISSDPNIFINLAPKVFI